MAALHTAATSAAAPACGTSELITIVISSSISICDNRSVNRSRRLLAFAVFSPLRRRLADRFEKPRDDLRAHLRRGEGQTARVFQRCARPEDFLLVDDDEAVVADAADGLREGQKGQSLLIQLY